LYLDNESHDGYRRDQDVFGTGVTTEDNLAVVVDYGRGATLSYALNAHAPWEGYRIAVNGEPCSAIGSRRRTSRFRKAKAATAAVTRCCWPTCSAAPARTGWNVRPAG